MIDIELLEKETKKICEIHNIDFKWTHEVSNNQFILNFKKLDKDFNVYISEKDLYLKTVDVLKVKIEYTICELLNLFSVPKKP